MIGVAIGVVVLTFLGWQLLVAANAWQTAQHAARVAARAGQVGAPVKQAALAALPNRLATRAVIVTRTDATGVEHVRVRIPIPGVVRGFGAFGSVSAETRIDP